jgi:hypothetical protein
MIAMIAAGLLGAMAPEPVPPARDGNIAILEELCAARAKASLAAYDLFIARHPGHPLEKEARAERRRLVETGKPGGKPICPPK